LLEETSNFSVVILKGWCPIADEHETSNFAISKGERESTYRGEAKKVEGSEATDLAFKKEENK
jgi:hypothetical protein